METYDYIIAGAGCAGLSLVHYLLESSLKDSKILLIDPQGNHIPDKTWCYWAENPLSIHPSEHIHFWNELSLIHNNSKITKSLGKLNYYHLNSHDFYRSIYQKLNDHPNVHFLKDEVLELRELSDAVHVRTKMNGSLQGSLVFDSRLNPEDFKSNSSLKQIFTGWRVKSKSEIFDPKSLVLMEFPTIRSEHFDFFYVLPFSKTEALVEYTAYSKTPIADLTLKASLEKYLKSVFGAEQYDISFRESGIIPMTTRSTANTPSSRVLKMGTAAGWTKASTGYTFQVIQKNCQAIVAALELGTLETMQLANPSRFSFYDNILLNIAHKWPEKLQDLFVNLFATSSAEVVLRFLSEETSFKEELQILSKLKFPIFIKSLLNYEAH
jgi:lycopene beta-cyclase